MKNSSYLFLIFALAATGCLASAAAAELQKPNVIVILTDDLGYKPSPEFHY